MVKDRLSLADNVCLTLIVNGAEHGWAVVQQLQPTTPLGRIWSLSRALTYRSIEHLIELRYVRRRGVVAGKGADRRLVYATSRGRNIAHTWLETPIEHLRDVRTELLLKLELRTQAKKSNVAFIRRQQKMFAPVIATLGVTARSSRVPVDLWRSESAKSVDAFLHKLEPDRH
jgi:PadR family transcriptional regulator AphA